MILKVWDERTQSYKGVPSIKGETPYIGENGNWWIGGVDTGVAAGGGGDVLNEDGVIKQEHLPQGYPYIAEKDLLEGAEYVFSEDDGAFAITTPVTLPIEGQTYKVTWNGTEYTCSAVLYGGAQYVLGNMIASNGEDTGEPFSIIILLVGVDGMYGVVVSLDGTTELNVSVMGEVVEKMDVKLVEQSVLRVIAIGVEEDMYTTTKTLEEVLSAYKSGMSIEVFDKDGNKLHITSIGEQINLYLFDPFVGGDYLHISTYNWSENGFVQTGYYRINMTNLSS